MNKIKVSVGDAIEVKRATTTGVVWNPATVSHVSEHKITAVYSDHTRVDLPLGQHRFRLAEKG